MPPEDGRNSVFYTEQLTLPWTWWVIATLVVLGGGTELWAGFNLWIALIVYAVLGIPTAVLLVGMGRARLTLDDGGLHAGGRTLALADVAAARVLDARDTRLRLGPQQDPRAHVFMRGWVKESVEITPLSDSDVPYWLVTTRHPDDLVTALRDAVLRQRA
jgi:hypothetical protein